jgi:hypothetical protein
MYLDCKNSCVYISSFGGNVFNFFIHYFFENYYNFHPVLFIINLDYEDVNLMISFVILRYKNCLAVLFYRTFL